MELRFFLSMLFLLVIMLAPTAGNPTPFLAIEQTLSRLGQPVTEREQGELSFLACLDSVSQSIPDRLDVQIVGNSDSYLVQRSQDLMYPRVRLVPESPDYFFHIGNEAAPAGKIVTQADCGGIIFTVVSNG